MDPRTIVNLGRYPIDNLESPRGRELIARCRRERPGMVFPELTVRDLMDPSPAPYCGQPV